MGARSEFPTWTDYLIEKSNLLRTLAVVTNYKTSNIYLSQIDRYPATYKFYEFNEQLKEGTYPSGIFDSIPVSMMLEINRPVFFRRNLECMIDICKGRNIGVILSTFAYSPAFSNEFVSSEEYISAFKENNALIQGIAKNKGIDCFDFASVFPTGQSYYIDGRHVNERGARLKANLFADYVAGYINQNDTILP